MCAHIYACRSDKVTYTVDQRKIQVNVCREAFEEILYSTRKSKGNQVTSFTEKLSRDDTLGWKRQGSHHEIFPDRLWEGSVQKCRFAVAGIGYIHIKEGVDQTRCHRIHLMLSEMAF